MKTLIDPHKHNWLKCWACCSFAVLIASGCDEFISDAVWTQERSIVVGSTNVEQCLQSALTGIPNVIIDRVNSTPGDIVLEVKFEKPIPSLGIFVRHSSAGRIKVMFVGKGLTEPDSHRVAITPVLNSIVNSIESKCSVTNSPGSRKQPGVRSGKPTFLNIRVHLMSQRHRGAWGPGAWGQSRQTAARGQVPAARGQVRQTDIFEHSRSFDVATELGLPLAIPTARGQV